MLNKFLHVEENGKLKSYTGRDKTDHLLLRLRVCILHLNTTTMQQIKGLMLTSFSVLKGP